MKNFQPSTMAVYNLRKELARQMWIVRRKAQKKMKIDLLEALENTRDLVVLCLGVQNAANTLQHKIMRQLTLYINKKKLDNQIVDLSQMEFERIKTRKFLPSVKLPKNYIG